MKKHLIIVLCAFIILLSAFALCIISTNTEIENTRNYTVINYIINSNSKNVQEKVIKVVEAKKEEERLAKEAERKAKEEAIALERAKKERERATVIKTSTKNESVQNNTSTANTNNIKYGTFGRLYVSNYNVALYDFNVNTTSTSDLQTLVDNRDSAAYYKNFGKLVIADHYYQGFSALVNLNEGDTSYIKFEDGSTIRYRLIKKSRGVNTGPDLTDNEGNSFFNMDSDIIMYTCYEDGIMATLWKLV